MTCFLCGVEPVARRTDEPYDDDLVCPVCGRVVGTESHSREFGERFEEVTGAKRQLNLFDERAQGGK